MRKQLFTAVWIASLLGLFFALSCRRADNLGPGDSSQPLLPEGQVLAAIGGQVLDNQRQPVSGATVQVGSVTTTTDSYGNFQLAPTALAADAALVRVTKTGFFEGSRTLMANAGGDYRVTIQLIPRTVRGTFDATSGGTVTTAVAGGSVTFGPNSIVTQNGAAYNGPVSVAAFAYDPSNAGFEEMMPGDLRGVDESGVERGMQSFAMMNIELSGAAGERLQVAPGKTASLSFPIPAALRASAPATIPLWYYNDSTGLWKQEGRATRNGTVFTGTVTHFTPWNCDTAFPLVQLKLRALLTGGTPLKRGVVRVQGLGTNALFRTTGYIDSLGRCRFPARANAQLRIEVLTPCNQLVYTATIGPFSTNSDLGDVHTSGVSQSGMILISGTAYYCSGNVADFGTAVLSMTGANYTTTIRNGQFSFAVPACEAGAWAGKILVFYGNQGGTTVDSVRGVTGVPISVLTNTCMGIDSVNYFGMSGAFTNDYTYHRGSDSLALSFFPSAGSSKIVAFKPGFASSNNFLLEFNAVPGPHTNPYMVTRFAVNRSPYNNQTANYRLRSDSMTFLISSYGPAPNGYLKANYYGYVVDSNNLAAGRFFIQGKIQIKTP